MIYFILILIVAFLPLPSVAFAVILTVLPLPVFFVFTTPFEETVAYFSLLELHFNVLFAVLPLVLTFAFNVSFFPAFTLLFLAVILILFTTCFTIFILYVALILLPSCVVAVIVTVFPAPAFFVVTTPFEDTVAYFLLLVSHTYF